MEIGTKSKTPTTPIIVQPIVATKLVYPLIAGTSLEIIPLPIQTFTIHVQVAIIVTEPVKGSEKSIMEQIELVDPSFIVLNNGVGPLEFLYVSLSLTPHQTSIG